MTEKPSLTRLLKANAGLGDQATLVYKYILIVGSLTVGEVCEYTGLSYELASKALDELLEKKLIRRLTHVVNRYVAVAPYRAFAELLVEFQRVMKELEENARKNVETALAEISKTNEGWKANAIKLREEQVTQAREDIRALREEATNARKSLIDKLRQETDAKSAILIEMLKRHLQEHTTKISDIEKDVTSKVDNSIAKFNETAAKLKEQVSQTATSYLAEFDERIQLFIGGIDSNLSSFQSDFSSSTEVFQGQNTTFLEDTSSRITEITDAVRTKTHELIQMMDASFGQISDQLQGAASKKFESAAGTVSASNKDFETKFAAVTKAHAEKLSEAINSYQLKTRQTLDGWNSAAKDEMGSRLTALKEEIENGSENLIQKIDSTRDSISETVKSHLSSVENASSDLSSNLVSLTESLERDLVSKTGFPTKELQESCETTAKECSDLGLALERLSKKNMPIASKTIKDFTSDVNSKLSKMTTSFMTNAKSFVSEIKVKAIGLIDGMPSSQPRSMSAESGRREAESQIKPSALKKELSKRIDAVASGYLDDMKRSIDTIDKQASDKISATLGFETELEKKWNSITETLGEVTSLAGEIKSFPQRAGKIVNDLVEQYGKKADGAITSIKRILDVHSTTLGDAVSGTTKKWGTVIERTKKEMVDVSRKETDGLAEFFSNQISGMENINAERIKTLDDLVSQELDAIKSEASVLQINFSRHVGSNTETIIRSLEDVEGKLKDDLVTSRTALKNETDQKSRQNDELSAELLNRARETMADLKGQLVVLMDHEKEQAKQVSDSAKMQLGETTSQHTKDLHQVIVSATTSFYDIIDKASDDYREEGQSIKGAILSALSQHLLAYTESVNGAIAEIGKTFAEHFEDCSRLTEDLGLKLEELLSIHKDKFEKTAIQMTRGLTDCMDQDEAAIDGASRKMLQEFTNNTTKIAIEAGSVENLMRTAWAEIIDTQQINADKTWHYVTKHSILNHIKDMVKRTKSSVTIVLPNLHEAPISEVKQISKAIRINIVAGVDATLHKNLVTELLNQGNVRIWNFPERNYVSCTRDAEEALIAPIAPKDIDCIATVSVEDGFIKLIMKIVGPMWLAASKMVTLDSLKS